MHAPTVEEIRMFEQKQKSRDLEEELEIALNFHRKIATIMIPKPQVIIILNSKEEVEILSQHVVKELLHQDLWKKKNCSNM